MYHLKKHRERQFPEIVSQDENDVVIESSPGVFYSGPVGNFILPEKRRRIEQLDGLDIKRKDDLISVGDEKEIKYKMCQTNDCQTSREMQLKQNGQSSSIQDRRKIFASKNWKSLDIVESKGNILKESQGSFRQPFNEENKTEAIILRRDSMRHIGDWFYPEGGWGWRVVMVSMVINMLSMGLIMSGGQVMVLSINTRVGNETDYIKTG